MIEKEKFLARTILREGEQGGVMGPKVIKYKKCPQTVVPITPPLLRNMLRRMFVYLAKIKNDPTPISNGYPETTPGGRVV